MEAHIQDKTVTIANLCAGLGLAMLGALAIIWLIPGYVTGANNTSGDITPGFMPRVGAWSMIAFGAVVAFSAFYTILGKQEAAVQESEENETLVFGRPEMVNTVILSILAAIYVFSLSNAGFIVPSAVILGISIYFAGYRRWSVLIVISIGMPVLFEYLLWHALKIPLPQFPLINF